MSHRRENQNLTGYETYDDNEVYSVRDELYGYYDVDSYYIMREYNDEGDNGWLSDYLPNTDYHFDGFRVNSPFVVVDSREDVGYTFHQLPTWM